MAICVDSMLEQSPLGRLYPATKRHVAQQAHLVNASAGAALYAQGDPPTGLFALVEGRVKLYRQSRERAQILALPLPGECFGAESFPTGAPSPCTAAALTSVVAVTIPPDALGPLLDAHPDLQELLLELIAVRLRQFVSLVHDLAFRDVTSRLAAILVSRATAEGHPTDEGISLDRLLSQQDFAAMAGSAREVICRIFKKLEKDGLLRTTPHSIHVLDVDGLREIAAREVR